MYQSQTETPRPVFQTFMAPPLAHPVTLSVIIPSYNGLPHLIPCLRSLIETGRTAGKTGRLQILVQDDCSDFDIRECIFPPADVERNEQRLGFAGNCNAGAKRAGGDILFFLNQDTRALSEWFDPITALFENPKIGIVGPKLVLKSDSGEYSIQSCGGLYDAGKGPFHRYLGWHPDDWRVNQYERVSWTTGAALAVRRDLFWKVGGFDLGYRLGYFEDVDLCEKMKAEGFEVWYCPQAVFEHKVGSSGGVPHEVFRANSMRFHRLWDERIKPDTHMIHVNF